MKEDIVDHVVFSVAMTGGEKMQDSGTQSENLQIPLESVPEEPDEDSGQNLTTLQREVSTPNVRIPSQSARATLVRTPATREKTTSPLVFHEEDEEKKDEEKNILITEIKPTEYQEVQFEVDVEQGEDSFSEEESVELKDLVVEPIEAEPKEEDYDTDLEIEEEAFVHDTSGRSHYTKICNQLGLVPINYFMRHIQDTELAMRYHGLGPSAARAIALVLKDTITLEKLDLRGNWIEGEGGEAVARMLEENDYVTDVCLADNRLGLMGAQSLCRMLNTNAGLRRLDISDNGFGTVEAAVIAQALETNKYLKVLNLSHNRFDEQAGEILGPAIGANDILDVLDLSWNCLRQKGAISVAKGIKENVRLKKCSLAWNGFGPEGGAAIADALMTNNSLQEIDISGNRLSADVAIKVAKAIMSNDNIRILKMGNNLLTTAGAIALAKAINESESSEMEELDLTDVPVEFEFLRIIEDIKAKRPNFKVVHGPILRVGNTTEDLGKPAIDPNPRRKKDPIMVLDQHIVVNDFRLLDILKRYDPDNSMTLEPQQFLAACEELAIPYDRAKVEEAVKRLVDQKPGNDQGRIYFGNFFDQDKLQEHIKKYQEKTDNET